MLIFFVLLSFAVYRVTRFCIEDNLIVEPRMWVLNKVNGRGDKMWRAKLNYLLRCPFCLSAWFTAGAIVLLNHWTSVPLPVLLGFAVWGGSMAVWRYVEQN